MHNRSRAAAALLAAVAVAALAAAAEARTNIVNTTAGATVYLGGVLPADGSTPNSWRAAAEIAVQDLNNDTNYFTDVTLDLRRANEGTHGASAVFAVQDLYEQDVTMIAGPINSDVAELTGFAASSLGINILDPLARQSSLSDKSVYPFYSRLSQPQATEAADLATVCAEAGWNRVGVFMGLSTGTADFLDAFMPVATAKGMEVLPPVQFPLDTSQGQLYIDQLKATGARVYVFLVPIGHSLKWMTALANNGLLEPEYTMVTPSVSWFDNTNMTEELGDEFYGVTQTGPSSVNAAAEVMNAWGDRLSMHLRGVPNDNASGINVWFTQMVYDTFLTAGRAVWSLIELKRFCDPLGAGGGGHDNCTAYLAEANEDVTLRRLIRATTITEGFLGAAVEFDATTGDRVGPSIVIQLKGYNRPPFVSVHLRALVFPDTGYTETDTWEWKDTNLAAGEFPRDRPLLIVEKDKMPTGLFAATAFLASCGVVMCVFCAAATVAYRKLAIIRMSSWRVNVLATLGGVLLLSPAYFGGSALTETTCNARTSLLSVGFTVLFAPLFSKIYRVYCIFGQDQIRTVKVTDGKLFQIVAMLLSVDAVLLAAWGATGFISVQETPLDPVPTSTPNVELVVVELACVSPHTPIFVGLLLSYKAALLVTGSYLAYKCRDVQIKALNDAKWVGLSIYTATLIALLAVPTLFVAGGNPDAEAILVTAASFLVVVSAMGLVFFPKFLSIWRGTTDEWTVNSTGAGSGQSTGMNNTVMDSTTKRPAPSKVFSRGPTATSGSKASMEMPRLNSTTAGPSSAPGSPTAGPAQAPRAAEPLGQV